MKNINVEERVLQAEVLFKKGYNCAQSVVGAYADLYGYTLEQALLMSASFGAGIGRMREVCGAACGMFLLAGFETGCTDPADTQGKAGNYKTVQFLAGEFRRLHGSIICAELLGLKGKNVGEGYTPEPRTGQYYQKRPCVESVKNAARIYGNFLEAGLPQGL